MPLKPLLLYLSFLFLPVLLKAQTVNDSLLDSRLSLLRGQIESRNYSEANNTLKKIFSMQVPVPDEVAFRYGQVQLGLNNNLKAREAFQKYISLSDSQGVYVHEALKLIKESEKGICKKCNNTGIEEVEDTCRICEGKGKVEILCYACRGNGREYCQVCKGNGVVLKNGPMGTLYQTCNICNGKGVAACSHCKGSGKIEKFCNICKGKGYYNRKVTCDHKREN